MSEIKLSEAIREGAKLRPQTIIKPFDYNWRSPVKTVEMSSCALGAAYEAVNQIHIDDDTDIEQLNENARHNLSEDFPELDRAIEHPIDKEQNMDLMDVIGDLNDSHDWTREQIADWLEEKGF